MFAVIKGTQKEPRFTNAELMGKYCAMAKKAIDEVCIDATDDNIPNRWALKQFAYCQARYISLSSIEYNNEPHTMDDYYSMFYTIFLFKSILSLLTPTELLQTFPVTKTYDGEKYQCKDYFYTMNFFKDLDMNKPFKEQGVDILRVLFNYQNKWLGNIVIHSMLVMDKISIANGGDDMFTGYCKSQGKEPPTTYRLYTDVHGKQYMIDSQGKTMPIKKHIPRYMKVVK